MGGAGYCQYDAGVIDENDKLTPGAKNKFIQDVKDHLILGSAGAPPLPIPCNINVDPVPFADQMVLEDETQYPEWHSNVLGLYESIAKALNTKGQFTLLPICDPLALAFALKIDPLPKFEFPGEFALLGLNLPMLAFALDYSIPVDLALEFPNLLTIPPGIDLDLPIPPDIKLPDFNALFEFAFPFPKFPDLILNLMLKMPSLFLGILQFDLGVFCDATMDAKLFGDFDPNSAIVWVVSMAVLASKTAECVAICATGSTLGSASGGIVGQEGKFFGYDPPEMETFAQNIRDKIVNVCEKHKDDSWGKDKEALDASNEPLEGQPPLAYTEFIFANKMNPPPDYKNNKREAPEAVRKFERDQAWGFAKSMSSCELFGRAVYRAAGSKFRKFQEPYNNYDVLTQLQNCRHQHNAGIEFSHGQNAEFPALKKGDGILIVDGTPASRGSSHHFAILVEDYAGGTSGPGTGGGTFFRVVQGGQNDLKNLDLSAEKQPPRPTAIGTANWKIWKDLNGVIRAGDGSENNRMVTELYNGAKMVDPASEE